MEVIRISGSRCGRGGHGEETSILCDTPQESGTRQSAVPESPRSDRDVTTPEDQWGVTHSRCGVTPLRRGMIWEPHGASGDPMNGYWDRPTPGPAGVTRGHRCRGALALGTRHESWPSEQWPPRVPSPRHGPIPVAASVASGASAAVIAALRCDCRTRHAPGAPRNGVLRDDRRTKEGGGAIGARVPRSGPT